MKVKSESEDTQSYLNLSDPMDCSLPGSSVQGIFQARVLEWGVKPGHAGKEGPHLTKTGGSRWFYRAAAPVLVSQGVRRGAQGASCVAPGKLGLDACGKGERVIALESW